MADSTDGAVPSPNGGGRLEYAAQAMTRWFARTTHQNG